MTVTVPRNKPATTYGWSGDGKTAAEISSDIDQTRYRLDADVQALGAKLSAARKLVPIAALGVAAAGALTFLIRRIRRRR